MPLQKEENLMFVKTEHYLDPANPVINNDGLTNQYKE